MIKLINAKGVPNGITFRKQKQNGNSFVLRVSGNGIQTDIGATAENMQECYAKAAEKRLELIGMEGNTEAFKTLTSAYDAFLRHYGIVIEPVLHYAFKFEGE